MLIDQQETRSLFLRKLDGFTLSGIEECQTLVRQRYNRMNFDPRRHFLKPCMDGRGCARVVQLQHHRRRNEDFSIKSRQKIVAFNLYQIIQR